MKKKGQVFPTNTFLVVAIMNKNMNNEQSEPHISIGSEINKLQSSITANSKPPANK